MAFLECVAYLVTAIAGITLLAVLYYKRKRNYWKSRGVFQLGPEDQIDRMEFSGSRVLRNYEKYKAQGLKYSGEYELSQPIFIPMDPSLIKLILQTDFYNFTSHGVYCDEENDPLSGNLFNLDGAQWKSMRAKLTPTFTSGKMKMMFQTFVAITEQFEELLEKEEKSGEAIDVKEVLARFTTDIIGSCAFGLECNSLKDPEAEFRKFGKKAFTHDKAFLYRMLLTRMIPKPILQFFKLKTINKEVEDFFLKAVKDTVAYREQNNIHRKDFLHLLLQLKNLGKITDDDQISSDEGNSQCITLNQLAAQCYVFFLAGFETSSTTMTFALYELALNQDIQEKLRQEIRETIKKHGKITYDAIMEMQYLDRILQETLRKNPPLPTILRVCTKDWVVPGTSLKIENGTRVNIPAVGLHWDPDYYPDPEKFDPDRFLEENKAKRPPCTWIPFGEGPRLCIGLRFGLMQSKVGIITLLRNYEVTLNERTQVPMKWEKKAFITSAEGGVWLNIKKLNEDI